MSSYNSLNNLVSVQSTVNNPQGNVFKKSYDTYQNRLNTETCHCKWCKGSSKWILKLNNKVDNPFANKYVNLLDVLEQIF